MKINKLNKSLVSVVLILCLVMSFGMGALASDNYGTASQSSLPDLVGLNQGTDSPVAKSSSSLKYLAPTYNTADTPSSGVASWSEKSKHSYTTVASATEAVTWGTEGEETWYVVDGTVTITGTVTCLGDVYLILKDDCSLTVTSTDNESAGICVTGDNTLTIYGQEEGTGTLTVSCSSDSASAYGAGIGGGKDTEGSDITINGGIINATCSCSYSSGAAEGAGIGGGDNGDGSSVIINGGTVTASCASATASATDPVTAGSSSSSASVYGAGIGGGDGGDGTGIIINGGTVVASCSSGSGKQARGAGIGGGKSGSCSDVTINGGTITASGNNGIGIGNGGSAASGIVVATSLIVKAGSSSSDAASVSNTGDDLASSLSGNKYVNIEEPSDGIIVGSQSGTVTYGTAGSATYAITITGIEVSVFTVQWEEDDVWSDTAPDGITISFDEDLTTLTITTTATVDAGEYTFKLVSGEYESDECTLTIDKAKVDVPEAVEGLTYDYDTQTGVELPDDAVYTLTNNTASEAGTYTAVASLNDYDNYKWDTRKSSGSDQKITWTISPLTIYVLNSYVEDKEYDGTDSAEVTAGMLYGYIPLDILDVDIDTATATFSDKNVGEDKTVTVSYTLTGDKAGDYVVEDDSDYTATITSKELTVSDTVADSKVYDGTTATTATPGAINGAIDGDDVAVATATGAFADAKAGTDKAVTVAYTLSGDDAGNYTVADGTASASITPKELTVDGTTVAAKAYDGTADATVTPGTLVGVVDGDTVAIATATGTFADIHAGTGKEVTVIYTLSGDDAANYTVADDVVRGNITAIVNAISNFACGDITTLETPAPTGEAVYGELTFTYCAAEDGEYLAWDAVYDGEGIYYVKATSAGTDDYASQTLVKSFVVVKLTNSITDFTIADIYPGGTPAPAATATNGKIVYTYSNAQDGTYGTWDATYTVPGTYYVKASVAGNSSYAGCEAIKAFKVLARTDGVATVSETAVDKWLITDEHIAYISGYEDGTFNPEGQITRAETAVIFYRLLKDKNVTATKSFSDVAADQWYAKEIGVLATLGILSGYEDGTFNPEGQITRGEFVTIALRFSKVVAGSANFSDITGHWAEKYIISATAYGWIAGYEDGTFHPDGEITRSEAVTIINRVLNRTADEDYIAANIETLNVFSDIAAIDWYYYSIMEAANGHDFEIDAKGNEVWK